MEFIKDDARSHVQTGAVDKVTVLLTGTATVQVGGFILRLVLEDDAGGADTGALEETKQGRHSKKTGSDASKML